MTTACIWGFAFVAQRVGMDHIGPFLFNGIRFALGAMTLVPLVLYNQNNRGKSENRKEPLISRNELKIGLTAGIALFCGSSLQQIGIVYTTAGKAGFITGLYVILVPLLGIFLKQTITLRHWSGAIIATVGLYLLSVTESFTMEPGDMLVLFGAFFWAGHVHIIGFSNTRVRPAVFAIVQYVVCSVLSMIGASVFEVIDFSQIYLALLPILYGGIMSVGIAYTLQVYGQRHAEPSVAAIILSFEAVFAVVGGWLLLSELLSVRDLFGCLLMLCGMIISQIQEPAAFKVWRKTFSPSLKKEKHRDA